MYQCQYVYSYCQQIISTSGISNSSVSLCLLKVTPCLSQNVQYRLPIYLSVSECILKVTQCHIRMYTYRLPIYLSVSECILKVTQYHLRMYTYHYLFISLRMYTQRHPMPSQNVHLPPTYLLISLRMYTQGHPMPSQNVHLPPTYLLISLRMYTNSRHVNQRQNFIVNTFINI